MQERPVATRHVVHVGYHKTASSWLQDCVFPHLGGLRYADPILGSFAEILSTDTEFREDDLRSRIERLGDQRLLLSHEGLSGSLWDGYGGGSRNALRLHAVMPGAVVLIIVRRQDEMLRSIYAQYVNEGGTRSLGDFVAGVDVEGSRFSLRHLEYDQLVSRYVEMFGRDRVWVAPYEQLRAEPAEFLGELCDMVGAKLTGNIPSSWPNRSLSRPCLWLLRTWNRLFRASRFNAAPLVSALPGGRKVRRSAAGACGLHRPHDAGEPASNARRRTARRGGRRLRVEQPPAPEVLPALPGSVGLPDALGGRARSAHARTRELRSDLPGERQIGRAVTAASASAA